MRAYMYTKYIYFTVHTLYAYACVYACAGRRIENASVDSWCSKRVGVYARTNHRSKRDEKREKKKCKRREINLCHVVSVQVRKDSFRVKRYRDDDRSSVWTSNTQRTTPFVSPFVSGGGESGGWDSMWNETWNGDIEKKRKGKKRKTKPLADNKSKFRTRNRGGWWYSRAHRSRDANTKGRKFQRVLTWPYVC